MNQKVKNHLTSYCKSNDLQPSDAALELLLISHKPIQETKISNDWGIETIFTVVEIEGLLIGFNAKYNRIAGTITVDLDSVYECEAVEIKTIIYKAKQQQQLFKP
jgi:hypothetical protein